MNTEDMIRIGKVNDVKDEERTARVFFEDTKVMSGWLKVIASPPFIPGKDVPQETESADGHRHSLVIKPWMPSVGDKVLCIFLPCFDGDGYILGGI